MFRATRICHVAVALAVAALGAGCSTSRFAIDKVMVPVLDNARTAAFRSNDIKTFRDAAPANLFLIEGLIETDPGNNDLRINAAMLYFSYAFAFQEETDEPYATILYGRGIDHGRAALSHREDLAAAWDAPFEAFETTLDDLNEKDVPAIVWTAANWAQFIAVNLDSTAVLRDIPKVTSMLERAAVLDGDYFEGLVYIMMGSLHSFRPPIMGGSPEKSAERFKQAFEIGGGSFLLADYFYAKYYTYRTMDAEAFEETLARVIARDVDASDPYRLLNLIAKEKSRALLDEKEDLF